MQTHQMIEVKMAYEDEDRFSAAEITVGSLNAVSRVKDDIGAFGPDKGRKRVSCRCIVPTICPQKDNLHCSSSSSISVGVGESSKPDSSCRPTNGKTNRFTPVGGVIAQFIEGCLSGVYFLEKQNGGTVNLFV